MLKIAASMMGFFLLLPSLACAGGEEIAVRKEFRQSSRYPYVFEPVPYLQNGGPNPLRFAAKTPDCGARVAPALPAEAKAKNPALATASGIDPAIPSAAVKSEEAAAPESTTTDLSSTPVFPVPKNAQAPVLAPNGADFTRPPDEVLAYFEQPDQGKTKRIYLFDPIFNPAYSTRGAHSKATLETH